MSKILFAHVLCVPLSCHAMTLPLPNSRPNDTANSQDSLHVTGSKVLSRTQNKGSFKELPPVRNIE